MEPETRRDRKKRLTRERIVDAAVRLFLDQGYESTTVAQIAAAADVDPKTFFNYFRSKGEVIFDRPGLYDEALLGVIADRRPGERPGELLGRVLDDFEARVLPFLAPPRDRTERTRLNKLIMTTPALQATLAALIQDLQQRQADALREAYPELDEITAAAMTGALFGAMYQAALVSIRSGQSRDQGWQAMLRARDVVVHGLVGVDRSLNGDPA
ncbi:TetR/AcrR family transcriptional regulator [Microlunatus sp. GCM10028923]|uniref:TetR/AcrR family transcriptional regulator n=1 Tax=Microlunatus sp. GCM10028923 TaxID=3273400 RepID=UPI0036085AAA